MTKESPFACNVAPFTPDQRARWQELGAEWRKQVSDIRELPDGFALRLPSAAEAILKAAEWMTLDRLCCPFMSFVLEIEAEGGPVWLRLTGREGTKEFMRAAMREAGE
jgi:hypothetical protein